MTRTILIDTDTASDDAIALIMALRSPVVHVAAITVVAGNVPLEQAVSNALYTVELCGADVPVFAGCDRPLERDLESATWFHGMDGLGDHGFRPQRRTAETGHAVDAILACAQANPGLEIITLGPLTNLATALLRDPALARKIGRCVVMGGAPCCEGNVTPAAEFNIWADPEAARVVTLSAVPIELVGWQLSRYDAALNAEDIASALALGTPLAHFAIECNSRAREAYFEQTGEHGISLPDPIAMAILLDPTLALEASQHFLDIETASPLTRGMTVVDRLNVTEDARNREAWAEAHQRRARANFIWKLDVPGWKRLLMQSLA
jgi:purine nucleosidase